MLGGSCRLSVCVRMTARFCFLAIGLVVVSAAQAEPNPSQETLDSAKAISELTAAYAKQGGYIATYRSVGEGKSLECTLGLDQATGLGVAHLTLVKGGEKMEMRQWSTANDRVFVASGDEIFVLKGMNEELKSTLELSDVLTDQPGEANSRFIRFTPGMLLGKTTFGMVLEVNSKVKASWVDNVKDVPIQASDEKTVTFLTKEFGLLTISRENGMLIRQSLTGENGEARVLELKDLQANPGKEAVAKISADWSTIGAKEKPAVARMAPLRLMTFQLLIDFAERGEVDKVKLDERLEEQYEVLRHFARACINDSEGPLASKANWPGLFDKTKARLREKWLQDVPGADAANEEAFLGYLQEPKVRLQVRDSLVGGMMKAKNGPELITDDIFGKGGWSSLKVGNDRGVAAKQSLVKALSRAYLEALIDLKMEKQWDRRDGLD